MIAVRHGVRGVLLGLFLGLIPACGASGGGDGPAPSPGLRVVSVVSTAPTELVVIFDRLLDPASVLSNGTQFVFSATINPGTASVSGNSVLLTTNPQPVGVPVRLYVAGTVTDTSGTPFDTASNPTTFTSFEPRLMFLAGGASTIRAGYYTSTGWFAGTLAGGTTDSIGLAQNVTTGDIIGVIRSSSPGDALLYTLAPTGFGWSALADVSPGLSTRGGPSLSWSSSGFDLIYQGSDFKHYFARYSGSWSPTSEPATPTAGTQSLGPSPATISAGSSDSAISFAGNDGQVYSQFRSSGVWQTAAPIIGSKVVLPPAITKLTSGDLMAVWVNNDPGQPDDGKLVWSIRVSGTWSAPLLLNTTTMTADRPLLAALAGGGAILGVRGTDLKGYSFRYDPGVAPSWSPATPIASPNPTLASTPAVTMGIYGADAEAAYVVSASGTAYHVRLVGTVWGTPLAIAGPGLSTGALASR